MASDAAGHDGRLQRQVDVDEERGNDGDNAAGDEVDARPPGAVGQYDDREVAGFIGRGEGGRRLVKRRASLGQLGRRHGLHQRRLGGGRDLWRRAGGSRRGRRDGSSVNGHG